MPSSRATIAAGTRPPRVMHTIAANGPASASRQARARASRWKWSQDTGKAFRGWTGWAGSRVIGLASSLQVEHEIEPGRKTVARLRHAHRQFAAVEAVAGVLRLVREIELRGEQLAAGRQHLEVIMTRAAGIESRKDGAETVAALRIGEDVAAVAEAAIVVFAGVVGVPEIDKDTLHRLAGAREHEA